MLAKDISEQMNNKQIIEIYGMTYKERTVTYFTILRYCVAIEYHKIINFAMHLSRFQSQNNNAE